MAKVLVPALHSDLRYAVGSDRISVVGRGRQWTLSDKRDRSLLLAVDGVTPLEKLAAQGLVGTLESAYAHAAALQSEGLMAFHQVREKYDELTLVNYQRLRNVMINQHRVLPVLQNRQISQTTSGWHVATVIPDPTTTASSLQSLLRSAPCVGGERNFQRAGMKAVYEAIERVSLCRHPDQLDVRASWNEVVPNAIHPNAIQCFSVNQTAARVSVDYNGQRFAAPAGLRPDQTIDWVELDNLSTGRKNLVPLGLCVFHALPVADEAFAIDSSGCAAGETVCEATLSAILELIERDAAGIWWYNRISRRQICEMDLDIDILDCKGMLQNDKRSLYFLDITTEFSIPTIVGISLCERAARPPVLGFGCNLNARDALRHAATEIIQTWFTSKDSDQADGDWERESRSPSFYVDEKQLRSASTPHITLDELNFRSPPIRSVSDCVRLLAQSNLEVLRLDQTCPSIGVPVIRLFSPGMASMWPRFGAKRLEESPVRRGLSSTALREEEYSQVSLPL